MTTVTDRPAWAMTGPELLTELDTLHLALSRLQTRRLEVLAALDQAGHARDLGARDTCELIALRHRLDPTHVRRDLRHATALADHPAVTAALADGDLHPGQAQVIIETLERLPATVPPDHVVVAETEMVTAAHTLGPRDLRRLGRAVTDRLDTDGPEPDEHTAHTRQDFWLSPTTIGAASAVRFGGLLANENAELLHTLIDAAAKPRTTPAGEPDPRTIGQRRADALTTVLRAAAATGGEIPSHGGIKPHLTVTIPLAALTTATPLDGNATPADPAPTGTAPTDPAPTGTVSTGTIDTGAVPDRSALAGTAPTPAALTRLDLSDRRQDTGQLIFGNGLSAGTVRRIACDAAIIPLVLGTNSEPLDVGREHRLVTPAIRRALITRDRGCIIPGCGAPPGHTDAHHLVHWADGGETSLDNLVLACPPHHRAIHHGTWIVAIVDGQVYVTRPDWTEPHRSEPGNTSPAPQRAAVAPTTGPAVATAHTSAQPAGSAPVETVRPGSSNPAKPARRTRPRRPGTPPSADARPPPHPS